MSDDVAKCKPHPKPAPYPPRKPHAVALKDAPKTSAIEQVGKSQLTLHDWLTVFAYWDAHPSMSQLDIVQHFQTQAQGALHFTQSTLSRKVKDRKVLEARANSNPNALSSK